MAFSELSFIFIVLPIFLIIYLLFHHAPRKAPLLFIGSIAIYYLGMALSPPINLLAAAAFPAVTLFTWTAGSIIARSRTGGKISFFFSAAVLAGTLAVFKYYIPPVPPGMSFYIFTAISYLADVYRKRSPAGSFVEFGAYFTMFPKLLSGPIARWDDIRVQFEARSDSTEGLADGIRLFITGLAEKVLLADTIGRLWSSILAAGTESLTAGTAWLGAAAFSLQLYLDFQGYSVMARGLGKMFGIELPVNFDYPYMSRSISEFWRRWHITLGTWFRDYVYIPLGGSRAGTAALVRNLFIVWLLTGIWHGATVNFLLWGLMLFLLIAAEKLALKDFLERHRIFSHIYVLVLIPISWMLFANTDLPSLAAYFGRMFSFGGGMVKADRYIGSYALSLGAGVLCSTPLPAKLFDRIKTTALGTVIYAAMLAGSIYMILLSGSGAFMYFSF